ncbi:MAG: molecular chaperone DnaJ [Candidatus Melainabacteria bacterium HGW-Melainabacteria-1]|nr:MAG: molecular chaperone DnaJ [Candidatus Melainabacteria bacterium HGW-Melainabacteria-1]
MATNFIDYYATLGVSKGASQDDIRKAYRKLARKFHPDVNSNDEVADRRFKEINEANEVLSDPDKRKKYDAYGKDWMHADQIEKMRSQGGFGGQHYTYGGGDEMDGQSFSDFFQSIFGGRGFGGAGESMGRQQRAFKGQDLTADLAISLSDAYQTHKRMVTVNGKQIRITVPAGIEDGQSIRLRGHGHAGMQGGPAGDLYLTFRFEPDSRFKREGADLHVQARVDLFSALLGGEVEIQTFSGPIKLKLKPGTQSGNKLRLKGKGYPVYKHEDQFGDLIVEIQIILPTELSEAERQLVSQWAQLRKEQSPSSS